MWIFRLGRQTSRIHYRSAWKELLLVGVLATASSLTAVAQQQTKVAATEEPLQEIVVTGSRIAAPNAVSTSPIQVISSESIATTGKTDISDLIMQLPQNLNNGLGQDLGNTTSGLTTPAASPPRTCAGSGRTEHWCWSTDAGWARGLPTPPFNRRRPIWTRSPQGLVDRIEVVTGGASAAYGSDAIAGVINFIMKKDFQGVQFDGQYNENLHDNNDTYMQNLVTRIWLSRRRPEPRRMAGNAHSMC